jgi:hypothetical protein
VSNVQLHFLPDEAITRRCGDCQLCCKLVPVANLGKAAGQRCRYQKAGKGCTVHARLEIVSPSCRYWNCRWLVNDDTQDLSRPDRSRYVIDLMPDYVTLRDDTTGKGEHVQVVQIWVDPDYPDAHKDPALRAFLERRAKDNIIGLIRWDNTRGMALFPPELSANGRWNEKHSDLRGQEEHSLADVAKALSEPEAP